MTDTTRVKGIAGLLSALKRDLPKVRRKVVRGARKAAKATRAVAIANVPVAFGEVKASVHVEDLSGYGGSFMNGAPALVADAPHAAAVEKGSRPHMPPLEPLIKWVKLRGMQALSRRKLKGSTSAGHALSIGAEIARRTRYSEADLKYIDRVSRAAEKRALRNGASEFAALDAGEARKRKAMARRGSIDLDVPTQIARAIQAAIAQHGTKPSWFMRRAVPDANRFVRLYVEAEVHKSSGGSDTSE